MIESLQLFAERLNQLDPADVAFVLHVDSLVQNTSSHLYEQLYPTVFRFFESHPEEHCEMPGTLVHLLEDFYPNYVTELLVSIARTPSLNTVLMVNRILNSDIAPQLREHLLECLQGVVVREDVSFIVREDAKAFLERHS